MDTAQGPRQRHSRNMRTPWMIKSRIVREKLEKELPSDYTLDYVLDVIRERIGFLEGIRTYYTTASSIRDREELVTLNFENSQKRTLSSLAGGRSSICFVVTKPGVHIFKEE
ncbi:hypothetical protein RB195_015265 [Necator americanus]|uniref:Uncharacterized protein n=1 Tax=Necator americanus TaxID=51031 RepID=A0ABR1E4Y8_NECAM